MNKFVSKKDKQKQPLSQVRILMPERELPDGDTI